MKTTLETAGPLLVPVDETGTAVGMPGDAPQPEAVARMRRIEARAEWPLPRSYAGIPYTPPTPRLPPFRKKCRHFDPERVPKTGWHGGC